MNTILFAIVAGVSTLVLWSRIAEAQRGRKVYVQTFEATAEAVKE